MKQLERFNKLTKPTCKYFIAATLFQNPLRIEFGWGWNDINRIGVLSHVLNKDVKAILDPICTRYENDRASIHIDVFNCISHMPCSSDDDEKLILIGADDIEISTNVTLIAYGNKIDVLSTLASLGFEEKDITIE
ncbi:hypothetical protein FDH01_gp137 [Acinetobacter phage vB_AbaM_ME3]|uniref:Uncharacterized protein n=1 Tax=Acinetobacter phage vB_AbaM_ME3 TaxID=1837876 RepID=A0A172Q0X3_9CAUD|nr:hypothetical protein FDH01_gp137 [Acinetobacter phage vB_AbaM_ME3]AND75485.1 hypothetical protein ME3_324 [Acinetobacter phage vB_AbaM_ME3]